MNDILLIVLHRANGDIWLINSQIPQQLIGASSKSLLLAFVGNQFDHRYQGYCPDRLQPDQHDPLCVACECMMRLRAMIETEDTKAGAKTLWDGLPSGVKPGHG